MHEQIDRYAVDEIPLAVLEPEHLRYFGKRLAVEQHEVLAPDAAGGIERRQLDVHHRIDRSRRGDRTIDHTFERTQHRQQRIDRRHQGDQPFDLHAAELQIETRDNVVAAASGIKSRQAHIARIGFRLQIL